MKIRKTKKAKLVFVIVLLTVVIFSFFNLGFINASTSTGSYSEVQTQYFSSYTPSFSQFGSNNLGFGELGSYTGSLGGYEGYDSEGFFDMQVMIPPFGCEPLVVTSDILEERDVPVFCKLVPITINPSIDITRIERISVTRKDSNTNIAGVGFHPALAAIGGNGNYFNNPTTDNLGYVVVVLKKQPDENKMPDNVTAVLSMTLDYGANYAYGFGENEFYLPVMTDSEFSNNFREYGFFNGVGYLRAENIDETGATISIYTTDNIRLASQRIEKGKTGTDIFLPTGKGGQGIRITLKNIVLPETKAKFTVNNRQYDVYEGGKFYDGKCTLLKLESLGFGTGTARINCAGVNYNLEKKLNEVELFVQGSTSQKLSLGGKIDYPGDPNSYYLVAAKKYPNSEKTFVIIANVSDGENVDTIKIGIKDFVKQIDRSISLFTDPNKFQESLSGYVNGFKNSIGKSKVNLILLNQGQPLENPSIKYNGLLNSNVILSGDAGTIFNNAIDSYEQAKSNFGIQSIPYTNLNWYKYSYGEASLWAEYLLAKDLGQQEKVQQILSRIVNDYPSSVFNGYNAQGLLNDKGLLSNEGSTAYNQKEDISITLVSITEPPIEDASVGLRYAFSGKGYIVKSNLRKGDNILNENGVSANLISFDENNIFVNYSCVINNNPYSSTAHGNKVFELTGCGVSITVDSINQKKIAQVQLTPTVRGRTRESNFTFSIGIEKRPSGLKLTPEEASDEIEKLNKQIADWKNITDTLGEIVRGGKAACLATSAVINLKNLAFGADGKATARNQVMAYWNKLCQDAQYQKQIGVTTVDQCISRSSGTIESQVNEMQKILKGLNNEIAAAEGSGSKTGNDNQALESQISNFRKDTSLSGLKLLDSSQQEVSSQTLIEGKSLSSILANMNNQTISYAEFVQLKKDYLVASNAGFSKDVQNSAKQDAYSILQQVSNRQTSVVAQQQLQASTDLPLSFPTNKDTSNAEYKGLVWNGETAKKFPSLLEVTGDQIADGTPLAIIPSNKYAFDNTLYLIALQKSTDKTYTAKKYYALTPTDGGTYYARNVDSTDEGKITTNLIFQQYDELAYKNKCKNCNYMKVFSLEPYKGMPALMPFDGQNGWYIQVKQLFPSLGTGEQKAYQDSGKISSFWLCNVGPDGMMEGVGIDKNCIRFDLTNGNTLDSIPGLQPEQAKRKVAEAIRWIEEAQRQLRSNPPTILINGLTLRVVNYEGEAAGKCTDFMSARDCKIIFNVCDPFVCPNSRCNLGGQVTVDNVIQSGVIGSTVLCLPNFIGFNKDTGVLIPVCLTGIQAGLVSWTNILEDYRDCLNESIKTNRTVGICDAVSSVFMCDLFWREMGPFAETLTKNLFLGLFGKKEQVGGAEYMFVQDAWNNAEKSMQYLQTTYGSSSKLAFGAKSFMNTLVGEFCQLSLSATYPNNFDAMLEPESPIQYHAFFDESTYESATVPPMSHYKVTYVINAGNDYGHSYRIYLRSAPTTLGYIGKERSLVDSGYIPKGGSVSKSTDIFEVSGFKELCVVIDYYEEHCGFKSVSTSFALTVAKDAAVSSQAATSPVTSESECVNGGRSVGSLLTPNIQQAASELVSPELYNQGIVRVCSNKNPGEGVNINRWSDVGYCSDQAIRCWLDTYSLEKAIQSQGLENRTLAELEKTNINNLINQSNGTYLQLTQGAAAVKDFIEVYNEIADKIKSGSYDINTASYSGDKKDTNGNTFKNKNLANMEEDSRILDKRLVDKDQRAELLFGKAAIYDKIARKLTNSGSAFTINSNAASTTATQTPTGIISYSFVEPQVFYSNSALNDGLHSLVQIMGDAVLFKVGLNNNEVGKYSTQTKKISIYSESVLRNKGIDDANIALILGLNDKTIKSDNSIS